MADSIYNELKIAMAEKIAGINDILFSQQTNNISISDITVKTNVVTKQKKNIDDFYFQLRDNRILCISMMLISSIIKIYTNINSACLDVIKYRNSFIQEYLKIKNYLDEYQTAKGDTSGREEIALKKESIKTLIDSYKPMFKNILSKNPYRDGSGNIIVIDNGLYDTSFFSDAYDSIYNLCKIFIDNDIDSINTELDSSNMKTFNIDNENVTNCFSNIINIFKISIEIITQVCPGIFTLENTPENYQTELLEDLYISYGNLESVLNVLSEKNNYEDIAKNTFFKDYCNAIDRAQLKIDTLFYQSYQRIKDITELTDRYECAFDSSRNKEYYNKMLYVFDDVFHYLVDNCDIYFKNNICENENIKNNVFIIPMKTHNINFAYNINTLIDLTKCNTNNIITTDETDDVANTTIGADSTVGEIYNYIVQLLTGSTNKYKLDNNEYRFTNIPYSDEVSYAMLIFNYFYNTLFYKEYLDIKEYVLKRLNMSGFIDTKDNDDIGTNAWSFMNDYKTLPFIENINDGCIPIKFTDFDFFNHLNMRDVIRNISDAKNYDKNDDTFDKMLTDLSRIDSSYFFETSNVGVKIKVLTVLMRKYNTKEAMRSLFYELSKENNFRSHLLAYIIMKHAEDIFYTSSSERIQKDLNIEIRSDYSSLYAVHKYIMAFIKQNEYYNKIENVYIDISNIRDKQTTQ